MVKDMHEKVRTQIAKKNEHYANQANKGRRKLIFEPGDWVWLHLRKERFPESRKSKLSPRGDGPFEVLKRIGDNAYQLDLPGEYGVSATFNVADLTPFDVGEFHEDPRTDPFQEGEDDGHPRIPNKSTHKPQRSKDPLDGLGGPMTRARARKAKEELAALVALFGARKDLQGKVDELHEQITLLEYPSSHLSWYTSKQQDGKLYNILEAQAMPSPPA